MAREKRILNKMFFPVGKLPPAYLERMLRAYTSADDTVKIGPSLGEDAAVIDIGQQYLLAKTDPVTFVAEDIGTYAIMVNANDIAAMGGTPRWFLATILLPEGRTTPDLVEDIFRQLSRACEKAHVSLCGGHTEITAGLDRPVVAGMMLGQVEKGGLITTAGARVGDDILLTKAIALEGTSIIAREREDELGALFGQVFIGKCKEIIDSPGIGVLREAEIAARYGEVHSMHDPTEGGLATGLLEISWAAGVGIMIEQDSIPVLDECTTLCRHYGLDPLGLIASGSLLVTLNPQDTEKVRNALEGEGIPAARIGTVVEKGNGVRMKVGDRIMDMPRFQRDEITKILG